MIRRDCGYTLTLLDIMQSICWYSNILETRQIEYCSLILHNSHEHRGSLRWVSFDPLREVHSRGRTLSRSRGFHWIKPYLDKYCTVPIPSIIAYIFNSSSIVLSHTSLFRIWFNLAPHSQPKALFIAYTIRWTWCPHCYIIFFSTSSASMMTMMCILKQSVNSKQKKMNHPPQRTHWHKLKLSNQRA